MCTRRWECYTPRKHNTATPWPRSIGRVNWIPKWTATYLYRGSVYEAQGEWSKAASEYQRVVLLDPNSEVAKTRLLEVMKNEALSPDRAKRINAVSITPALGHGTMQVFTALFTHPQGAGQISQARILLTHSQTDGRPATFFLIVHHVPCAWSRMPAKMPCARRWRRVVTLKTVNARSTSETSSVHDDGNTCTVAVSVSFKKSSFAGEKRVFLAVDDFKGHSTDFEQRGIWTIP